MSLKKDLRVDRGSLRFFLSIRVISQRLGHGKGEGGGTSTHEERSITKSLMLPFRKVQK